MNAVSRKFTVALAALTVGAGTTGCASMSNTEKGAATGAGVGGAIGAVIGRQTGGTARGAIIGAVVGGAAGAVIGRRMDRQAEQLESTLPAADWAELMVHASTPRSSSLSVWSFISAMRGETTTVSPGSSSAGSW